MTTLADLENQCAELSKARLELANALGRYTDDEAEIRDKHMAGIREAAEKVNALTSALELKVQANKNLFEKPKSQTLHGIRCGYAKSKGKIEYLDDATVVKRIREKLPEKATDLISVTEKPIKSAMNDLTRTELSAIGVSLSGGGDAPFVKPADSDLDKTVKALLTDD